MHLEAGVLGADSEAAVAETGVQLVVAPVDAVVGRGGGSDDGSNDGKDV